MNLKEKQILLAKFLKWEFLGEDHNPDWKKDTDEYIDSSNFNFDSDWNYLMKVVTKIESIEDEHDGHYGVYISSNSCTIQGTNLHLALRNLSEYGYVYFDDMVLGSKEESTFEACVRFVEWFNNKNLSIVA